MRGAKKRGALPVVVFLLLVGGLLAGSLIAGNRPLLGLDLDGGVSVVLQPTEEATSEQLDQAIEIIRRRVDSLGVAEPEITRRGDTILVQIPGIEDRDRALDLVGKTAELRFRPVLGFLPEGATTGGSEGDTTTTVPPGIDTTVPAGTTDTTVPTGTPDTTAPPAGGADAGAGGENSLGPLDGRVPLAEGDVALGAQEPPTTEAPTDDAGAPTAGTPDTTVPTAPDTSLPAPTELPTGLEPTAPEDDIASETVILPGEEGGLPGLFQLGPTDVTGEVLEDANAALTPAGAWQVDVVFKGGADGIDLFNALASQCASAQPTCPTGQIAITLDAEVVSAPQVQQPSFQRDQVVITGDFTEREAKDLALVLKFGALPVELEPQQVQVVSATIGSDALQAGLVAALVGLVLVTLYMAAFYRLLGLVAIASLVVSTAILWVIIAYLGSTQGLALTLAGVTGIIVSIGVSLDSNIVYYEHLKEDVRAGRTLRSSVDRSWAGAFKTIVKADLASLIGATLLYLLTIGSVRGFALYLGIATLLDLVASYFFMRPLVHSLGRSRLAQRHPTWLGLPHDEAEATPQPVTA